MMACQDKQLETVKIMARLIMCQETKVTDDETNWETSDEAELR